MVTPLEYIVSQITLLFGNTIVLLVLGAALLYLIYRNLTGEHTKPILWVVISVLFSLSLLSVPWTIPGYGTASILQALVVPAAVQPTTPGGAPAGVTGTYQITGTVENFYTGAALGGTSAKVDVIKNNDWTTVFETITVSTSAKAYTSTKYYTPGETVFLHAYCTEFGKFYDVTEQRTLPLVTTGGTTPLLVVDAIKLKQRVNTTGVSYVLTSPTGTSLSSATGSTNGTQGSYSASGKSFSLKISVYLSTYSCSVNTPMTTLQSLPPYTQQNRVGIIWLAINNTAISQSAITARGFQSINNPPPGWAVFWMKVPEVASDKSSLGSWQFDIPIDTTALSAGKYVLVYVYGQDLCLETDAAQGIYDAPPTAYGAFSSHALTTLVPTAFYYRTTSNVPAISGALLSVKITTA